MTNDKNSLLDRNLIFAIPFSVSTINQFSRVIFNWSKLFHGRPKFNWLNPLYVVIFLGGKGELLYAKILKNMILCIFM